MRLLYFLICLTAALSCCNAAAEKEINNGKLFSEQQKFLLEIVWHVQEPVTLAECEGVQFVNDVSQYKKFDSDMQSFLNDVQHNRLLPRTDFFSALVHSHHKQALGLYKLFAYAQGWTAFKQNICWARTHINPGMFVYTLDLAIRHREDCESFVLPPIYEILPQHFFNSQVINRAMTFSEKKVKTSRMHMKPNNGTETASIPHNWQSWQWWKPMGLSDERWYRDESSNDGFTKYWTPVDYTRDVHILNAETHISYLLEDVDWNTIWYELSLDYPPFLEQEEIRAIHHKRAAEWWIHQIRTLMTRYNLERLSQGMKPNADMTLSQTIATGYNPQLVSWNGQTFWQRYNNYEYADYGFPATIDLAFMRVNSRSSTSPSITPYLYSRIS